MVNFVGRKK